MPENNDPPQPSGDSGDQPNEQVVDSNQETPFVDSKDDMFVDASEELNLETPGKQSVSKVDDDNGRIGDEHKNERKTLEKEISGLQEQLKLMASEDGNTASLHEVADQFSKLSETAEEERVQHENALGELQGIINRKDHEIADLTAKISATEVVETVADRMMISLSAILGQQDLPNESITDKLINVENQVASLCVMYNDLSYGVDQLKRVLSKNGSDLYTQEDFGSVLGAASSELFELRQKETELFDKLSRMEDENKKLSEQISEDRETIESVNTEIGKLKADYEQEKVKCSTMKEKLNMAVTKGKALVQKRDDLNRSLSEKTSELENRLTELQEKTNALEACESIKRQLEQSLADKTEELEKCLNDLRERSESVEAYELMRTELECSLSEKTKEVEECLRKLQETSSALDASEYSKEALLQRTNVVDNLEAILSQIDIFEEMSDSDLETRVQCLKESFFQAKAEISMLRDQIESLSSSLSAEIQEKDDVRKELDDAEERVHRVSLEKDEIVKKLAETSSLVEETKEAESFETIQSLVYVRDLELSICEEILGSQVRNLSDELELASRTHALAKEEKGGLEKDLERSEEKNGLLREKLSLAIKKGKGLFQDRENLKHQLDEKNSEINKLKLESEQLLSQKDSELDKVTQLVDMIPVSADLQTKDSSDKIELLAAYFKEAEMAKREAHEELERVKEEVSTVTGAKEEIELELKKAVEEISSLTSRLDEVYATKKTVEEALMQAEKNISEIISEKEEAQSSTEAAVMELEKLREEALIQIEELTKAHDAIKSVKDESEFQSTKMEEAYMTIKSLEEVVEKTENSLCDLRGEKAKAEVEISNLNAKLDACMEELACLRGNSESRSMNTMNYLDDLQMVLKDEGVVSRMNGFLERENKNVKEMELIVRDIRKHFADMEIDDVTEGILYDNPLLNGIADIMNSEENVINEDEVSLCLKKIGEKIKLRDEILEKNFESFSGSLNTRVESLIKSLTVVRDDVVDVLAENESLKENTKNTETVVREQENTISRLRNNFSALLSACGGAVRELQFEAKNALYGDDNGNEKRLKELLEGIDDSECIERVKELYSVSANIRDMEKKLDEASVALERVVEERDSNLNKVSSLETQLEALCRDFKAKETELCSLNDSLISGDEVRALFDKLNGIELPLEDRIKGVDQQNPYDVKKLLYMIDYVSELQHQVDLVSYEKKELESEIQSLKKMETELNGLVAGLDKLLNASGGYDTNRTHLLQEVEKHVTSLVMESENSQSKAQELGHRLAGSQKLVDELSSKVKLLEDKLQRRDTQSVFEVPSTSEISEIDDTGPLGKSLSATAQVRTVRKGSTDHLAINVDSESEHLMNHEDKGHVFKSLNVSGLIPKQGKMMADRIDGIWVSGGKILMSRPRARLGVIAYCLLLHLWLLASIL